MTPKPEQLEYREGMIPNCEHSEQLDKLMPALIRAIGKMEAARKDSKNPHFNSKYADLTSIMEACKPELTAEGLAAIQPVSSDNGSVCVATTIIHDSGQWLASRLIMTPKDFSPQAAGSAITYARRYALTGMLGMTADDDDGNAASAAPKITAPPPSAVSRPQNSKPAEMPKTPEEWEGEDPALVDYLNRAEIAPGTAMEVYTELGRLIRGASNEETARSAYKEAMAKEFTKDKVRHMYKVLMGVSEPPL
jgi:hypothetical protein